MDEANSKIATSNLIILSPKDLAKLGLNLILSNAKNKNRKNEESCTNHQLKKKKHPTRKNIQMSKSDPRDELSANESVDSNMDMISEGILDGNEPISLEPHRGKPRTTKTSTKINDSCNESSASPSTSEFLNTPQTRKKMPKNNIHKVSFQKPFSNSKAAKNASIKSTHPNVEKLENNLIPLKKLKPRKSNKKTCLTQPEPSLVENSISYEIEKMHQEPCKLIENDLDNSKAVSPYQKKKMEESKNQEDIETLPERHESLPILDQENKTSRTNNSSCDDMEIDIVKNNRSSLTKVSSSPTKKMEESKNQENIETLLERHESLPILDQESKTSRANISLYDEMEIDIVKNNRSSLTKVSPSPTNKLEESKNQEDIETPPERNESLPILDQESKTSRTNNSSCDDMEIDIVKNNRSSLTKVSPSPTKKLKREVIVHSNTLVSFTPEELKHLVVIPMKSTHSNQSNTIDGESSPETIIVDNCVHKEITVENEMKNIEESGQTQKHSFEPITYSEIGCSPEEKYRYNLKKKFRQTCTISKLIGQNNDTEKSPLVSTETKDTPEFPKISNKEANQTIENTEIGLNKILEDNSRNPEITLKPDSTKKRRRSRIVYGPRIIK